MDARNKSGHDDLPYVPQATGLQRDDEQRVDLWAVEHDGALDEAERGAADVDAVEVAAGGEQAGFAVMHDADREEVRPRLGDPVRHPVDAHRPEHVPIAVRLEHQDAPQRRHPVDQHAARGAIDHPMPQPGLVAVAVGDQVAAIIGEEIRPFLEPVVVDAIGIGGAQIADAEPQRDVVHSDLFRHCEERPRRSDLAPGRPHWREIASLRSQ